MSRSRFLNGFCYVALTSFAQISVAIGQDAGDLCKSAVLEEKAIGTAISQDSRAEREKQLVAAWSQASASTKISRLDELNVIGKELSRIVAGAQMSAAAAGNSLTEGLKAACGDLAKDSTLQSARTAALDKAGFRLPTELRLEDTVGGNSKWLFFAGNVNALEADGGWESNLEASLLSRTSFTLGRLACCRFSRHHLKLTAPVLHTEQG